MKMNWKVNPYHFPIIIITAFVIGIVVAMALGFRPPSHGSRGRGHGYEAPTLVQSVTARDLRIA